MVMVMGCKHCGKSYIDWYELIDHQSECPVMTRKLFDIEIKNEVRRQLEASEKTKKG